jgi:hypothetical protein
VQARQSRPSTFFGVLLRTALRYSSWLCIAHFILDPSALLAICVNSTSHSTVSSALHASRNPLHPRYLVHLHFDHCTHFNRNTRQLTVSCTCTALTVPTAPHMALNQLQPLHPHHTHSTRPDPLATQSRYLTDTYGGGGDVADLEARILAANPMMESFGNAKTTRACPPPPPPPIHYIWLRFLFLVSTPLGSHVLVRVELDLPSIQCPPHRFVS